jgi:hypothetical protein
MVSAADRATDERVTCLRIFADAAGETHMEDVDIALQPRKLFKDNPPLRLSDNFPASWFNICHVPAGMCEVDWHNLRSVCSCFGLPARLNFRQATAMSADLRRGP